LDGHRRILAAKRLNMETIKAHTISIAKIVEGEYAANEIRKDFTLSERVSIAAAVRRALEGRQGSNQHQNNCSGAPKGKQTRELAAQKSGIGSHATLERAERVVAHGNAALVEMMDKGGGVCLLGRSSHRTGGASWVIV
jgi:hypothetical protein